MTLACRCPLAERSDATAAAALTRKLARELGMAAAASERLALATLELATNAVRHAGSGEMEMHVEWDRVTVVVLDRGPGLDTPERLFEDRPRNPAEAWQPGQSLGAGGPSVRRLVDEASARRREGGGLEVRAVMRRRR
ncbi:MAG: ATP-binding protein [Myxococcota bacterium]